MNNACEVLLEFDFYGHKYSLNRNLNAENNFYFISDGVKSFSTCPLQWVANTIEEIVEGVKTYFFDAPTVIKLIESTLYKSV